MESVNVKIGEYEYYVNSKVAREIRSLLSASENPYWGVDEISKGDEVFYIEPVNDEIDIGDEYSATDFSKRYVESATVCKTEKYARQQGLRENLSHRLMRYSYDHGLKVDMELSEGYTIGFTRTDGGGFDVNWCYGDLRFGEPFFVTESAAHGAVEDVVRPFLDEYPTFNPFM